MFKFTIKNIVNKTITYLLEANNDSIQDLEERVINSFLKFGLIFGTHTDGLQDTGDVKRHFREYIERREKSEQNFNALRERREKMFLRK
jgi:hypothetical protein